MQINTFALDLAATLLFATMADTMVKNDNILEASVRNPPRTIDQQMALLNMADEQDRLEATLLDERVFANPATAIA